MKPEENSENTSISSHLILDLGTRTRFLASFFFSFFTPSQNGTRSLISSQEEGLGFLTVLSGESDEMEAIMGFK